MDIEVDAWKLWKFAYSSGKALLSNGILNGEDCNGEFGGCCSDHLDLMGLADDLIEFVGPCPGCSKPQSNRNCWVCGRPVRDQNS